jgi:hypothetical protein
LQEAIGDFYLLADNHQLVIEVKNLASGDIPRRAVDQLLGGLNQLRNSAGLLVANADLDPDARQRLEDASKEGYQVRAIKWNSPSDNPALSRAIQDLLSAA